MNRALIYVFLAMAGTADAQTIIYDTFNETDQANLFDCCNALQVSGGERQQKVEYRIPFVPVQGGRIVEIDIALGYVSGVENLIDVSLVGINKGVKHKFRARDLPSPGQCCSFAALPAEGVPFVARVKYYIRVGARKDTIGTWNLNTLGLTGDFQIYDGMGWQPTSGTLPAVRIIGK